MGGGYGQIAYVSSRNGIPQIYLFDIASQSEIMITDMPNGACQPSWSPDGNRLVFISPCGGMDEIYYNAGLYIINADGSGLTKIPTVPGGDFDPAWSPDGKTIAFTSLRTKQLEIFILSLNDPSAPVQITKGALSVNSRWPAWSPDGTQIAYSVNRLGGVYQIWLMNADGSGQQQIVRSGVALTDYMPTWSRDGKLILFNQRCATKYCQPYLMTISSTDRTVQQGTPLLLNVITIENVEYSPDGSFLVYEGGETGVNNDIFYMDIAGTTRVRVTTNPSMDFQPTWRPMQALP
jgi:Tol biopolymer transport system component